MRDSGFQTFFDVLPQPCQRSSSAPSSTLPVMFKTFSLELILNQMVLHTFNYASTAIATDSLLYCQVGLAKLEEAEVEGLSVYILFILHLATHLKTIHH